MESLLELANKIYKHGIARGLSDTEAKHEAFDYLMCWVDRTVQPESIAAAAGMSYEDFKLLYMPHNDLLV